MRIDFYAGPYWKKWSPKTLETEGMGGSEVILVELSTRLVKLGHGVTVWAEHERDAAYNGVVWSDWRDFEPEANPHRMGVLVSWRRPEVGDWLNRQADPPHALFLAQDTDYPELTEERSKRFAAFGVLSDWHAAHFAEKHPYCGRRLWVTRNGVSVERFDVPAGPRHRLRALYASSPERGLDVALAAWPAVLLVEPEAELRVAYGFETLLARLEKSGTPEQLEHYRMLAAGLFNDRFPGVTFLGNLTQRELVEEMRSSSVLFYPNTFEETSCCVAMEAQLAGLRVVTSALGALPETVKLGTVMPPGTPVPGWSAAALVGMQGTTARERLEIARVARESFDLRSLAIAWEAKLASLVR